MSTQALQNPFSRSLGLHLLLILMIALYSTFAPKTDTHLGQDEPISVTFINKKESDANHINVRPSEGTLSDTAKKDSYLSDKTRVVRDERSALQSGGLVQSKPKSEAVQAKPKVVSVSDLGVKIAIKQPDSNEKQKNWASNSMGEAVRGGEYIKGLKQGETSALNTKESIFFSYFERVRRQLDQTWPALVRNQIERIYRSGRHLASQTDFTSSTLITISSRGEIVRVQLLQESGAVDLDSAAVGAWNKAGPFPNPPKGLLDESGNAQIRWDFILKT